MGIVTFTEFVQSVCESKSDEFVLQALADKDINAYIEDDKVLVDKTEVSNAQRILKSIGCKKKAVAA